MKTIKILREIKVYDDASYSVLSFLKFRNLYLGKIKFNPKDEKYYFKVNPLIDLRSLDEDLIKEIHNQIEKLKNGRE